MPTYEIVEPFEAVEAVDFVGATDVVEAAEVVDVVEAVAGGRNRWPLAGVTMLGISHEGDTSGGAKPSSEAAFLAAVSRGFRHIETDIRATQDGFLLAIHTVSGTKGGRPLVNQTRAEIEKALGYSLVDLDVMMAAPFEDVLWNLEVKSKADAVALMAWMRNNPATYPMSMAANVYDVNSRVASSGNPNPAP